MNEGYAPVTEITVVFPAPMDGPDAIIEITGPPSAFLEQFRFRQLMRFLGIGRWGRVSIHREPLPELEWLDWVATHLFPEQEEAA